MGFVGGELQAEFMQRVRGVDADRCLVVPIDVGKSMAMSLVADHYGEIIVDPFEFDLTESGVTSLIEAIAKAEDARSAVVVRVGVEACTAGMSPNTSDRGGIRPDPGTGAGFIAPQSAIDKQDGC
jgi:hypothetical protein